MLVQAKNAFDNLNGFHLQDRYLVVLYHAATKTGVKADMARREAELEAKKKAHGTTIVPAFCKPRLTLVYASADIKDEP